MKQVYKHLMSLMIVVMALVKIAKTAVISSMSMMFLWESFWIFLYNEKLMFQIPFTGDEPDIYEVGWCTGDFYFAIISDIKSQETSWSLTGNQGFFLQGGGYDMPFTVYSQRACLPDGTFVFTIYDFGGDRLCPPSTYFLYAEDQVLVDGTDGSVSFFYIMLPNFC